MSRFNHIGIDPSLISTALVVNGKLFNYCREKDAMNKSGLSKWFKYCEDKINLKFINYREYENYSDGEIIKLKDYDKITDQIIKDIEDNIDKSLPTKIGIEGYSYSSDAGAIIDLVTFSTLLRKKLFDYISTDITVFSPSTLKLESCKLTYPPINEGKKKDKWVYKNSYGISGGNLTKHGMFMCIVDNNEIKDDWSNLCKTLKDDIMGASKVPKPFEDLVDSWCLYNIVKKNL
jgi:hypothetical protein